MRVGGFPSAEEPVDEGGVARLARLDPRGRLVTSPALAARQTADGLGGEAIVEPALRDIDAGGWVGRSIAELHAADEAALAAWLVDPAGGTPDGETMAAVAERIGAWLAAQAGTEDRILAITHAAVIRTAIAIVLDVPPAATLAIDVAPLSATVLSFHRRWRLQELRRA